MKLSMQTMAMAVALVFAGSAYAQQPTTPQPRDRAPAASDRAAPANETPEKRIEREHKAAMDACKPLKGNAQDVCKKEADGKQKIAKAELKVQKKDTPENRKDLAETKAKAEYDVAMERCEDQKGDGKQACQREAKSKRDTAMAAAKGESRASTGAGSVPNRTERAPAVNPAPADAPKSGTAPKY
jgi:hypothetical protein